MVDYEFLDFDIKNEIKNIKKYIPHSMEDILNKCKIFLSNEEVYFIDEVEKINKFGFGQKRYLILTNKAIYNIKSSFFSNTLTLKRRISYNNIKGLTFEPDYKRIVIHGDNIEYDYYYEIQFVKKVVAYISAFYETENSKPLKLAPIQKDISLKSYVTTKEDKNQNQNFSKMNLELVEINLMPRYFNSYISSNPRKLKKDDNTLYNQKKIGREKVNNLFNLIQQDPSLLEKICIICLKDKDNQVIIDEEEKKNYLNIKNNYFNELIDYIRKDNCIGLKDFIKQKECKHFYHKLCINYSKKRCNNNYKCILCSYSYNKRNFYLFEYPTPRIYFHVHAYLNGIEKEDIKYITNEYFYKIYEESKHKYISYFPSYEKRKLVQRSIELRDKLQYSSEYIEYNGINFMEIPFDEESIEKYTKEYENCIERYNKKHKKKEYIVEDDDDNYYNNDYDEYDDYKPHYENNNNNNNNKRPHKLNYILMCGRCITNDGKKCFVCFKKRTIDNSKYFKEFSFLCHDTCLENRCFLCKSEKNLQKRCHHPICRNCYNNMGINIFRCKFCLKSFI